MQFNQNRFLGSFFNFNFSSTQNVFYLGKKLAMQNIVSVLQQMLTTGHSILLKDLALVRF